MSKKFNVVMSDDMRRAIDDAAREAGTTPSAWVRGLIESTLSIADSVLHGDKLLGTLYKKYKAEGGELSYPEWVRMYKNDE